MDITMATNKHEFNIESVDVKIVFQRFYNDLMQWRENKKSYFEKNSFDFGSIGNAELKEITRLEDIAEKELLEKYPESETEINETVKEIRSIFIKQRDVMDVYRTSGKIPKDAFESLKNGLPRLQELTGGRKIDDPLISKLIDVGALSQDVDLPELKIELKKSYTS